MHLTIIITVVLSFGALLTYASHVENDLSKHSPKVKTDCFTHYSARPTSKVRTKYMTRIKPCTSTTYSTVTVTTTPAATFTSTVVVSTTSTDTTVVPTLSGFIAIQTSFPGSGYDGFGGTDPISQRSLKEQSIAGNNATRRLMGGADPYAVAVHCYVYLEQCASTVTATQTATVAVITSVPTVTTTSTAIVAVESTTIYEVCAQNNLADQYNGDGITNARVIGGSMINYLVASGDADSAYDCCASALTYSEVGSMVFLYTAGLRGECSWAYGGACSGQSEIIWAADVGGSGGTLGNLYCGEVTTLVASY